MTSQGASLGFSGPLHIGLSIYICMYIHTYVTNTSILPSDFRANALHVRVSPSSMSAITTTRRLGWRRAARVSASILYCCLFMHRYIVLNKSNKVYACGHMCIYGPIRVMCEYTQPPLSKNPLVRGLLCLCSKLWTPLLEEPLHHPLRGMDRAIPAEGVAPRIITWRPSCRCAQRKEHFPAS